MSSAKSKSVSLSCFYLMPLLGVGVACHAILVTYVLGVNDLVTCLRADLVA